MYETLRDFVSALDKAGELHRVAAPVSPNLEVAAIADRVSKSPAPHLPSAGARRTDPRFHHLGGKALLFENVQGSDIPVLINGWGSYRRVEIALGCNDAGPGIDPGHTPGGLESLAERLGKLIKPEPPPNLLAKLQKLPELMELAKIPPKRVRSGICQQVVLTGDQVDVTRLPIIKCWPLDGDLASVGYPADINRGISGVRDDEPWLAQNRGRYITLGTIHTIHADDVGHPSPPSRNVGMYRVQVFGPRTMAMHWHMHHDGARHWRSWKARGEKMPVAIAFGGESVLPYAATAPMPPGISELLLAGFLNRGAISMVPCKTVPLDVPANSEIVIEGYVSNEAGPPGFDPRGKEPLGPGALFEGPFGDHTGFYSLPDRYPILEVTAITHRRDPIYPTTIVGLPPQEDYYLGKATERLFLPLLRTIIPDILDYDLPIFGAFHNCAFLKIKKEYPFHARRVMHSVWGAGQMAWTKSIFVVDDDVDVHDHAAVLRTAAKRCEPVRDVETVNGPLDILDHAAPALGAGMKIGFDCTRKVADEERRAVFGGPSIGPANPPRLNRQSDLQGLIAAFKQVPGVIDAALPEELTRGWLLIRLRRGTSACDASDQICRALRSQEGAIPPRTLLLGPDVDVQNIDEAMFNWLANFDPGRDTRLITDGPSAEVYDATPKVRGHEAHGMPVRDWPPIISMSEAVRQQIAARWSEFGLP